MNAGGKGHHSPVDMQVKLCSDNMNQSSAAIHTAHQRFIHKIRVTFVCAVVDTRTTAQRDQTNGKTERKQKLHTNLNNKFFMKKICRQKSGKQYRQ